jgi:hypothetical protein
MASPGTGRLAALASSPAAPAPGYLILYFKTDGVLYIKDSANVETPIGTASGITSLTGEATATGPGAAAVTLSNSAVIGKLLTGFVAGPNSPVLATDTILQAVQKLQAQATAISGTSLVGDVTGTFGATVVSFVGGESAADVATSVNDTQAATASNTSSTIVKRDASGNFSANIITADLTGAASDNVLKAGDTMTGPLVINNSGAGALVVDTDVLVVDGSNNRVGINQLNPTQALDVVGNGLFSGTITASNISGTNTGDVTLAAVGASPNANAASLSGQVLNLQPADSTNPGVLTTLAQSIAGIKTFINQLILSDTTQSTDKDTGSLVTEGGIGVEKNINAGGNIAAVGTLAGSNLSGTNTGDVTVTDTDTIDLTLTGQALEADVRISDGTLTSDAGGLKVGTVPVAQISGFDEAAQDAVGSILTDTDSINLTYNDAGNIITSDLNLSTDAEDAGFVKINNNIQSGGSPGLRSQVEADTPVQIGTTNFAGAANKVSRADHVHSHGNQTSGTLHAVVTNLVNGFMSTVDKIKLDAATALNTVSTLVLRDSSGDFAAGTITANLTGAASANLLKAGDVMTGYFRTAVVALSDGANISTDAALGNIFTVTIAGNRTFDAPTNPLADQKITYKIRQDAVGGRVITWDAAFNFGVDLSGVPNSTSPNVFDYYGFQYNATTSKWDCLAISRGYT